jgi:exonuclease SbcC
MTIKLKRVELSNIRSHKHVVFEPEDEGITAISGPNGTGKSTIVDSIAWVLYGTKPQGVSKVSAIYREDAIFGEDKCFAIVEIETSGKTLKIERRMVNKGGSVECEVWELEHNEDGTENYKQIAGPAVSHAEPYIRKMLKMDEKGFLSAILVQQKQVDQLISAGPRERARVIEDLTGISAITNAATSSRQEANSLRKVASLSTIDEDGLVKLKTDKENLENSIIEQVESVKTVKSLAGEIKKEGVRLKEEVTKESQKLDQAESLNRELTVITTKIESHEEELDRLTEDKKAKKEKLSLVSSGTSLDEIEPKVSELKRNLRTKELSLAKNESTLKTQKKSKSNYSEILGKSELKNASLIEEVIENTNRDLESTRALVVEEDSNRVSTIAEIKKLKRAISVLSDGEGTCPTCLQHVSDVDSAVNVLQKEIQELTSSQEKSIVRIVELRNSENEAKESLKDLETALEAISEISRLETTIEQDEHETSELRSQIIVLDGELKGYEKIYNEARRHEETKNDYNRLLKRAVSVSDEIERLKTRKIEITEELKIGGVISAAGLEKLRKKLDDVRSKHNQLAMEYTESRGELNLAKERLLHLSEKIVNHENEIQKYQDLLKSVEVAVSSTNLIEEFREERIKNSIPVIEVYASDLLSRFTEGKFSRLKIDSKFNTSVVLATGAERAVGLLSGGELSAASMSLRLAISMLLNTGASRNLIILDEVLVSQDAERAELILTTVKDVCKGQVVLIAHNDSIDGIADKVVEL